MGAISNVPSDSLRLRPRSVAWHHVSFPSPSSFYDAPSPGICMLSSSFSCPSHRALRCYTSYSSCCCSPAIFRLVGPSSPNSYSFPGENAGHDTVEPSADPASCAMLTSRYTRTHSDMRLNYVSRV